MSKKNILDYFPFPNPRPNQVVAMEWLQQQVEERPDAKYFLLEAPVGCHAAGTPILLHSGHCIPVENVKVGDVLMGPDSLPRRVLDLHQGSEQMYEVVTTKGDSFVVNAGHVLSLITTNARTSSRRYGWKSNYTGQEIINITVSDYLKQSTNFKKHTKLYQPEYVDFPLTNLHTNLPMDPYLVGLFLGDGYCKNASITTADVEIVRYLYTTAKQNNLYLIEHNNGSKATTYRFSTKHKGGDISTRPSNTILEQLRNIGLDKTTADTKFVPNAYKTNDRHTRLQVLAGLLDADGYHYKTSFEFVSKSENLANDIAFIARSVGLSVRQKTKLVNNQQYHLVLLSGNTGIIPTKIKRKQAPVRKQIKRNNVFGFSVSPVGHGEYFGFTVDSDNLYLMGNFIVTHNSGKSAIGMAFSRYLSDGKGNAFVLTPQRILQQQYEKSFVDGSLASLYGKSNYTCRQRNTTCDIGSIVRPRCNSCPYTSALAKAIESPNTVFNYKLALLIFAFTAVFARRQRELMVLDECHTLEQHLCEFGAVGVSHKRAQRFGVTDWPDMSKTDIFRAHEWVGEKYLPAAKKYLSIMFHEIEPLLQQAEEDETELTRKEAKRIQEYEKLQEHIDGLVEFSFVDRDTLVNKYVLVFDRQSFKFKQVTGGENFRAILKPNAKRFLFMSSTILNKEGFCRDLNLNPDETVFLSVDSDFPPENRPVYYIPHMKMNATWKDAARHKEREEMLNGIKKLLEMHDDENGIIHTANFQITKWLIDELNLWPKATHEFTHHLPESGDDRNSVINAFMANTRPTVLISPSITEGLDLVGDMSRFAIFAKVPFGYLGDQWIKRRMQMSKEWYQRQALINIIQGGGRVVRSKDDWASVYILDQSWQFLYSQTVNMVPQWWKNAYQRM